MEKCVPKLMILLFVFLLILDDYQANAVISDTGFECPQRSRKLIQLWEHEGVVQKIPRKLRTVLSPPAPQANRFRYYNLSPPPPQL
ncbi:hypothetical protein Tco_0763513 [Tanacetum coccineum]